MRTQEQILARINASTSLFGFDVDVLTDYLETPNLLPLIKDESREKVAAEHKPKPLDRAAILKDFAEYMSFAWGKASSHRGLSAERSITKLLAWLWLLEEDKLIADVENAPYENYGCPKLALMCERLGLPGAPDDAAKAMADGRHCGADYECGCGR